MHPCTGTETLYRPYGPARRGNRGVALLFLDHGTGRGWGVSFTPPPLFTPGKDLVPIVQEAWWAPGPVWIGAEISPLPGFDPRTVQPVASRYTDYATRSTLQIEYCVLKLLWVLNLSHQSKFCCILWEIWDFENTRIKLRCAHHYSEPPVTLLPCSISQMTAHRDNSQEHLTLEYLRIRHLLKMWKTIVSQTYVECHVVYYVHAE